MKLRGATVGGESGGAVVLAASHDDDAETTGTTSGMRISKALQVAVMDRLIRRQERGVRFPPWPRRTSARRKDDAALDTIAAGMTAGNLWMMGHL
mmetsp:Transcript_5539/g.13877  ORF Transcript_5539/g.13877 Transcript_5539/m.13877 type:complete len:95 (-) Transcript_5539:115-399(-)